MEELGAAFAFAYTTLSGDATLQALQGQRVYRAKAPAGATFPATIYQWQGGGDTVNALGGRRLVTNLLLLVKAVDVGSDLTALTAIDARIDALLNNAKGTANGYYQEWVRQAPFYLPTVDGGVSYEQLGGVYAVVVHAV